MNVDEMDLVSQLKEAAPLRPEAYQRARATLRAAMGESGSTQVPEMAPAPGMPQGRGRRFSRAHNRRRTVGTAGKVGIGAGIAAVAAGVAVALAVTSTPPPTAPAASASASQAPAVSSLLVSLASHLTADSSPLPGNATLIIRTQTIGSQRPDVSYNLYTDSGAFYGGGDKRSLMEAVARHQNMADGMLAGEVKVALYAAAGDLTTARERMATVSPGDAWLGLTGAAQRAAWDKVVAREWPILKAKGIKTRPTMPVGPALRSIIDNRIWNNGVDALSAGAGNPQVRAGVLRLLSTISAVTVAHSTTGGQPTLTLTAGPEVFGDHAEQVLTINAQTGMPIKAMFPANGKVPASGQTFQVSRLTLADIEAGKF